MYTKHHGNNIGWSLTIRLSFGMGCMGDFRPRRFSRLSHVEFIIMPKWSRMSSLLSKRERHAIGIILQAHLRLRPHIQVDMLWNKLVVSLSSTMLSHLV